MGFCNLDVSKFDDYTGIEQWNAVYTVQLGELLSCGVFDWGAPLLDWSDSAYSEEQYARVCAYFIERFYFREISIVPFREWAMTLHRKIAYELMPKYKPLYEREAEKINPLAAENEYYKSRTITSEYPETLLSSNSDYITDGRDEEFQRVKEGDYSEQLEKYAMRVRSIDALMLDELESMFVSLYTANVNGSW